MLNNTLRAGAASRYGSGSDQTMRLLAAPAQQHCYKISLTYEIVQNAAVLSNRSYDQKL
jgi:hypothetical protein